MAERHYLRPVFLALCFIVLLVLFRSFLTPPDFGVHGRNFTYGFYRLSSIDEWKSLTVKYKGKTFCKKCHLETYDDHETSKHSMIQCENCHGPAENHPASGSLSIPRNRTVCLRCHAKLFYPNKRGRLAGIDAREHYPDTFCAECHNPHSPNLEEEL